MTADPEDTPAPGGAATCLHCGGAIERAGRRGPTKKYCSVSCRAAWANAHCKRWPLVCVICSAPFTAASKKARCCSKRCGKILSDQSRSARVAAERTRTCQHCSTSFVMRAPSGKARRGATTEGRFCSRACQGSARRLYATKAESKRAHNQRSRIARGLPLAGIKACVTCGTEFAQANPQHLACSDVCRTERAHQLVIASSTRHRDPRPCVQCGKTFAPAYGDKRSKFCGPACSMKHVRRNSPRNHRERAKRAGVAYEPVSRLKVFDRDGWRCQVCGSKTPKRLMGSCDARAPELDHRIPIALGGGHLWSNVQCACRRCNGAKGGTVIAGQMPLFDRPPG
jgi:5-methylcytosine-specific restriction endonuclease McrA